MIKKPIVVALDFSKSVDALEFLSRLNPQECRVKVGKELFTAEGPEIVRQIQGKGFEVFLDLKFHDIPNTTASAVEVAAELGVWMVNVHASGGREMMSECVKRLAVRKAQGKHAPLLIGVTVLTSMAQADLDGIGVTKSINEQVLALASLAKESGLDGIVCSAQEAQLLKSSLGKEFLLVTPGIRPAFASKDDQTRILTPKQALEQGSDYLVIGRPITRAENPDWALKEILKELE